MKEKTQNNPLNTVALDIKRTLAKDGFLLSRTNPFFNWIRGEQVAFCHPEELGLSFYIANPPAPTIAPYDYATVFLSLENPEMGDIYFRLTFYFHTALEPCMEMDEIEAVYNKHDSVWFRNLSGYLADIEDSFKLSWDTDYDESIEDNLTGWIPIEKAENIHSIMKELKSQDEQWSRQEDQANGKKG